ncbi:MAG: CHAT domain-containing protein [Desulfobacterales bacterium]
MSDRRVYILVRWKIPKGKYNYHCKIYDAASNKVYDKDMGFSPTQDNWNTWSWYKFNPYIDEPGIWKFEIYIDGIEYVNESFPVVGIKIGKDRDLKRAEALRSQAWSLFERGDYNKAESLYNEALEIMERTHEKDSWYMARCLHNLAYLYQSRGDYDMAIPLYERALPKYESDLGSESFSVARCLHNMGWSYYNVSAYKKAKLSYNRTLRIYEKIFAPNHLRIARASSHLGDLYMAIGDYDKAESLYTRALEIRKKHFPKMDTREISTSLNDLAWLYEARGEYARAIPFYLDAIAIRGQKDSIHLMNSLAGCYVADGNIDDACDLFKKTGLTLGFAACYYHSGEYGKAIAYFKKSLQEKTGIIDARELAYIGLGRSYEALDDLDMAKQSFKSAIDLIETKWRALGTQDKKNFMTAVIGGGYTRLYAYEGMVRVILKEKRGNYQQESLMYAEMVKSRTFLEMLAAKQAKGVGTYDQYVLNKDRNFQRKISFYRKAYAECRSAGPGKLKIKCSDTKSSLEETLRQYERFINEVKLKDSELASLITVEVTPVSKIQSLLNPALTLLEYFMTADTIYVWLVTADNINVYSLPLEAQIIQRMVNHLLMSSFSDRKRGIKPALILAPATLPSMMTGIQEKEKDNFQFIARDLYQLLLEPVIKDIHTNHLIIVPHGALHKIPFAALHDGKNFLIEKYSLSVVPSLTVIDFILKKRNPNQNQFLALANPETDHTALRFAEKEVLEIAELYPKREIYLQKEATEGVAKRRSDYADVVHFATHGEFNDRQPMQSGLLLSKDAENDGYLQVHEIFGLNFSNTNLVILSACDTAISKIYNGDDLVGLSRAFIYAGTPTLLATLWSVDDRSTYILMKDFYHYWHNQGLDKIEALRRAQNSLKAMPGYSHPFYWAPFILIGDWQ